MTKPAAPPVHPPFRTRTEVLFASRADVAVVLRRGPKRHWQLLTWNTRRDTFAPGQWMKGLVRLMDLSPRGDNLIYWAAQYHPNARWNRPRTVGVEDHREGFDPLAMNRGDLRRLQRKRPGRKLPRYMTGIAPGSPVPRPVMGAWTAVSTPPYFSALAIWPTIGHWTGGGFFATDHRIVIYESECGITPIENAPIPIKFSIGNWSSALAQLPPPSTLAHCPSRVVTEAKVEIELALKDAGARYVDWIYLVPGGDLLFACDGSIYRHDGHPAVIDRGLLATARKLIDLAPNRFELIPAPNTAMRW